MTIEKLPSGKYRVRQQVDKKRYDITFDHKPTVREAQIAISELLSTSGVVKDSFISCAKHYVSTKANVISVTTEREYNNYINLIPKWFSDMNINKITANDVQKLVNELALDRAPKTVRNYHAFVSGVLGVYNPRMTLNTTLPQKKRTEIYLPSNDDVKRLVEAAKGSEYELALILMMNGLRRSEVCAVDAESVTENIIHIDKAKVLNKDKQWVIKSTKTTESERDVVVPQWVADKIKEQGYAYNGHPNSIIKWLERKQKELGIEKFSPHKLRHYYVARLSELGVDRRTIQESGGWSSPYVMDRIYDYSLKMRRQDDMKNISKMLNNFDET